VEAPVEELPSEVKPSPVIQEEGEAEA